MFVLFFACKDSGYAPPPSPLPFRNDATHLIIITKYLYIVVYLIFKNTTIQITHVQYITYIVSCNKLLRAKIKQDYNSQRIVKIQNKATIVLQRDW